MSIRRRLLLLLSTAAILTACGEDATGGAVPNASPQVAWVDGTTHVVQGDVEREISGRWIPWLWLPNGDLLLHTPPDSAGMGVYRPASGTFVVTSHDEWSRDKYDGGEYGLDGETGAVNAANALLRIVDGDQPAEPSRGPSHSLVDYDYRLKERARIDLPVAAAGEQRDYDFPVRVGAVTFIAFEDVKVGGDLTDPGNTRGGILRVEGDQVTVTAVAPYVQRLFLSSDMQSVFAVTSDSPPEMGDVVPDNSHKRVLELDPMTGDVVRDLGAPGAYDGIDWQIERVDAQAGRVAVQITTDCGDDPACVADRSWVTDGRNWTEVADQAGASWFWQPGGVAVSRPPAGRISSTDGATRRTIAVRRAMHTVASGSLLPSS